MFDEQRLVVSNRRNQRIHACGVDWIGICHLVRCSNSSTHETDRVHPRTANSYGSLTATFKNGETCADTRAPRTVSTCTQASPLPLLHTGHIQLRVLGCCAARRIAHSPQAPSLSRSPRASLARQCWPHGCLTALHRYVVTHPSSVICSSVRVYVAAESPSAPRCS